MKPSHYDMVGGLLLGFLGVVVYNTVYRNQTTRQEREILREIRSYRKKGNLLTLEISQA